MPPRLPWSSFAVPAEGRTRNRDLGPAIRCLSRTAPEARRRTCDGSPVISSSRPIRLAIQHPNPSDAGSEEDLMSAIVLSEKGAKLMKLCDVQGLKGFDDLMAISVADSLCPAICMTEGCDHVA